MDARFSFNRSIRIGSRRDRITGDSGTLTGRELLSLSRVVRFLARRLPDKRDSAPDPAFAAAAGADASAAGRVAAEGDGWVAASEEAGDRHRQPAGRGPRGTAGQRVERLLSPARVSSDRGVGGGDGRHPGPAAARGAGPHGGRRDGVRAGGAGSGGAASVRQRRSALRRGISRRAADSGAGGAVHALCGPGAWATPC